MTIDHQKQIEELNELVSTKIAPSSIHGVGVFAIRDIPKGSRLYTDIMPIMFNIPYKKFNQLNEEVREIILGQFPNVINGSQFAYPITHLQAYMNHSENANYDAVLDITLCDIAKGEEVTEDYRKIEGAKKIFTFIK